MTQYEALGWSLLIIGSMIIGGFFNRLIAGAILRRQVKNIFDKYDINQFGDHDDRNQ